MLPSDGLRRKRPSEHYAGPAEGWRHCPLGSGESSDVRCQSRSHPGGPGAGRHRGRHRLPHHGVPRQRHVCQRPQDCSGGHGPPPVLPLCRIFHRPQGPAGRRGPAQAVRHEYRPHLPLHAVPVLPGPLRRDWTDGVRGNSRLAAYRRRGLQAGGDGGCALHDCHGLQPPRHFHLGRAPE